MEIHNSKHRCYLTDINLWVVMRMVASNLTSNLKKERRPIVVKHRTPDRKAWVRCPMPPNILRVHTEYVLVKSVGPKYCGLSHERRGTGEYFPHLQLNAEIVEVVSPSIVPSGNFAELNRTVTCMVLKTNDRRTSSPLPRLISEGGHTCYRPLLNMQVSKKEQRGVIRFLAKERFGSREMHQRMKAVYDEYSLCRSSVVE
ncbi:hypothetical protein TNCV_3467051 [Trichonephila clavipes]|nr:hypothetical protein TNCV_3467051 [Trichonephila clavipes]